ncbi:hypothetical protein C8035_v007748 [Colletotrichum spinosum]|uniref:Uncharacterized protein n=1 Tax=Colletotrichum spinosum TaxID=1347390 RepID=A0A4R8QGS3_9PEZI|nr:hypothetical protein C8035_v007748 [Colletotrichum spinosum]
MQLKSALYMLFLAAVGVNAACGPEIIYCQGACVCDFNGARDFLDGQCKGQGKKTDGVHQRQAGDINVYWPGVFIRRRGGITGGIDDWRAKEHNLYPIRPIAHPMCDSRIRLRTDIDSAETCHVQAVTLLYGNHRN